MSNMKDIQQIKNLIAKGKSVGYLTFEEVNKALPTEVNTPEQIEEIIRIFDSFDIAIVDTEKEAKCITVASAEPETTAATKPPGSIDIPRLKAIVNSSAPRRLSKTIASLSTIALAVSARRSNGAAIVERKEAS